MGIAAYNRGSTAIAERIHRDNYNDPAFVIMDRLNNLPKAGNSTQKYHPNFDNGVIYQDRYGTWIFANKDDPSGSFVAYKTLTALVKAWDISLIGYDYTKHQYYTINT